MIKSQFAPPSVSYSGLRPPVAWGLIVFGMALLGTSIGLFAYNKTNTTTPNPCAGVFCGFGVCVPATSTSHTCECLYGFTGDTCQLAGCTSQGYLVNQTVLSSIVPKFVLPFMNRSTELLWLVSSNALNIFNPVSGSTVSWTSPLVNERIGQGPGLTFYVQGVPCFGTMGCVAIIEDDVVSRTVTGFELAQLLGLKSSFTFTTLQCDSDDAHTYMTVATNGSFLLKWNFALTEVLLVSDVSNSVNVTDTVVFDPTHTRLYVQHAQTVVWFQANLTSNSKTIFTLSGMNFPVVTYVQTYRIDSIAVSGGFLWVAVRYQNWTLTDSIYLFHLDPDGHNSIVQTSPYLPLLFTGQSFIVYSSITGNLFMRNDQFLVQQTCAAQQITCPACNPANSICQSGVCQCLYPYFNGTWPNCLDINECASTQCPFGGHICDNYVGGFGCHTAMSIMPSWLAAMGAFGLATVRAGGFPNQFFYTQSSLRQGGEFIEMYTALFCTGSGNGQIGDSSFRNYLRTIVYPSPDDREFCVDMYKGQFTNFGFSQFHNTNTDWMYIAVQEDTDPAFINLALVNVVSGQTIATLPTSPTVGTCSTGVPSIDIAPFSLSQDGKGYIWVIYNIFFSSSITMLAKFNDTLSAAIDCVDIATANDCYGCCFNVDGKGLYPSLTWGCGTSYGQLPFMSLHTPISISSDVTTVVVDFNMTTIDVLSNTNHDFTTTGLQVQSVNERPDSSIITMQSNVAAATPMVQPAAIALNILSNTFSTLSTLAIAPALPGNVAGGYFDKGPSTPSALNDFNGGAILLGSYFQANWLTTFDSNAVTLNTPSNVDMGLGRVSLTTPNPCASNNGGCGNQFCVQTTTNNVARCDICQRFNYVQTYIGWEVILLSTPSFKPKLVFSDPFESTHELFIAGAASPIYRVNVETGKVVNPPITTTLTYPLFEMQMSLDTHETEVFIIKSSFVVASPSNLVQCIDYATNSIISSMSSSVFNVNSSLTDASFKTKAFGIDRTRIGWGLFCGATQCVMGKFYTDPFVFISTSVYSTPATNSYTAASFSYDWKWMFFVHNSQFPGYIQIQGGADYVVQTLTQVWGPAAGPYSMITASLQNQTGVVDVTPFGFIGLVVQRNTTEATWFTVEIYDHAGQPVTEVPFELTRQHGSFGVVNLAVQIHFSTWGDLFLVMNDGTMMTAPCAASS